MSVKWLLMFCVTTWAGDSWEVTRSISKIGTNSTNSYRRNMYYWCLILTRPSRIDINKFPLFLSHQRDARQTPGKLFRSSFKRTQGSCIKTNTSPPSPPSRSRFIREHRQMKIKVLLAKIGRLWSSFSQGVFSRLFWPLHFIQIIQEVLFTSQLHAGPSCSITFCCHMCESLWPCERLLMYIWSVFSALSVMATLFLYLGRCVESLWPWKQEEMDNGHYVVASSLFQE